MWIVREEMREIKNDFKIFFVWATGSLVDENEEFDTGHVTV